MTPSACDTSHDTLLAHVRCSVHAKVIVAQTRRATRSLRLIPGYRDHAVEGEWKGAELAERTGLTQST